jgi:hypothetical protein
MAKTVAKKIAYGSIKRASVVQAILSNAKRGITTIVRSHNGNSKSAIIHDIKKQLPQHRAITINMSVMEAGDLMMPKFKVLDGKDIVAAVPHEQLGLHIDGPVILFIDEIFKAKKALQVQLAELLYERKLGNFKLSDDSIIFGASNLEDEGFGDQSLGFVYNRIALVEMAKVTGDEWTMEYAIDAGVHPTILAAAKEYPSMFADYRDYSVIGENQYIFDPRQPTTAFVTLRSLERASNMLYGFEESGMSHEDITHCLTNVVGPRAAADVMAVHVLKEELPAWADIIKLGAKAKVPKSAGARCLLIYTAISSIEDKSIKPWMDYASANLKKEEQALFACSILKVSSKAGLVSTNSNFLKWVTDNSYLYQNN